MYVYIYIYIFLLVSFSSSFITLSYFFPLLVHPLSLIFSPSAPSSSLLPILIRRNLSSLHNLNEAKISPFPFEIYTPHLYTYTTPNFPFFPPWHLIHHLLLLHHLSSLHHTPPFVASTCVTSFSFDHPSRKPFTTLLSLGQHTLLLAHSSPLAVLSALRNSPLVARPCLRPRVEKYIQGGSSSLQPCNYFLHQNN